MDAKQALEHYKANGTFYMDNRGMRELAELIEQQAEEIEKRDRMIEKIYKPIKECDCNGEKAKCDVLDSFEEYYQIDKGISPWDLCEYYWLCEIAWIEKEAEVQNG